MTPRISIIMGIYNCADTLPEALDSLYAQTYRDFKLILCDDGSTDNTFSVAKGYAEKYDNIVLTHVLEHIDDPVKVLKRINDEWLSDTGRFFLVCPNAFKTIGILS